MPSQKPARLTRQAPSYHPSAEFHLFFRTLQRLHLCTGPPRVSCPHTSIFAARARRNPLRAFAIETLTLGHRGHTQTHWTGIAAELNHASLRQPFRFFAMARLAFLNLKRMNLMQHLNFKIIYGVLGVPDVHPRHQHQTAIKPPRTVLSPVLPPGLAELAPASANPRLRRRPARCRRLFAPASPP